MVMIGDGRERGAFSLDGKMGGERSSNDLGDMGYGYVWIWIDL